MIKRSRGATLQHRRAEAAQDPAAGIRDAAACRTGPYIEKCTEIAKKGSDHARPFHKLGCCSGT